MKLWHFGGLNPTFKEFAEKNQNKTMLGMAWAFYWRFVIFILVLELIFFVGLIIGAFIFRLVLG